MSQQLWALACGANDRVGLGVTRICKLMCHGVSISGTGGRFRGWAGGDVRPGMVAAVHTASSDLRWHRMFMRSAHVVVGIVVGSGTLCRAHQ